MPCSTIRRPRRPTGSRALELLQLFGPHPSKSLLIKMSRDKQASLRAKAAYLMGPQASEKTTERLGEMLSDSDLLVQRMACESLARCRSGRPGGKTGAAAGQPRRTRGVGRPPGAGTSRPAAMGRGGDPGPRSRACSSTAAFR